MLNILLYLGNDQLKKLGGQDANEKAGRGEDGNVDDKDMNSDVIDR